MPIERETEIDASTLAAISTDFEKEQEGLFTRQNVVGVGVGTNVRGGEDSGEPCVKVLVSQKLARDLLSEGDVVPPKVGRHDTDVEEVGVLFAGPFNTSSAGEIGGEKPLQSTSHEEVRKENPYMSTSVDDLAILALTKRIRPAEGGFSVGHYKITAGTIATAVHDRSPFPGIPRKYYILSNNHVLANSNDARIGDPVLQPGPYDGGTIPGDVIARLSRFVPIRFLAPGSTPLNLVDAALAEGPFHWLDREIYWIGYVKGVRSSVRIGELLQKTGRTTNYTTGRVTAINAIVNVNYGGSRVARFGRQIVTTSMSAGGDSGSLVLDFRENAVGLLFAGSSVATIINNIAYVQSLLGIRVV